MGDAREPRMIERRRIGGEKIGRKDEKHCRFARKEGLSTEPRPLRSPQGAVKGM